MPPVPRQVPAPPAMARSSGVMASTWWISRASGWVRGSASYSPSMSLNSTSRPAPHSRATMADRVSLSPSTLHWPVSISADDTESFSLTTGITPSSSRASKVLCRCSERTGDSTSSPVRRIWATVRLYSAKSLS